MLAWGLGYTRLVLWVIGSDLKLLMRCVCVCDYRYTFNSLETPLKTTSISLKTWDDWICLKYYDFTIYKIAAGNNEYLLIIVSISSLGDRMSPKHVIYKKLSRDKSVSICRSLLITSVCFQFHCFSSVLCSCVCVVS